MHRMWLISSMPVDDDDDDDVYSLSVLGIAHCLRVGS